MSSVARKLANSGEAAKRLAKTALDASLPLDASVFAIVAGLEGHDLSGVRRQWRAHLGGEPPAHLQRQLLMRILAYRLQPDAFGGLDKSIQRMLASKKEQGTVVAFDRRAPQTPDGVARKARAGRDPRGRLRLEWPDFSKPVPDRWSDDRDELERSSLLRAPSGKDRCRE